jgi:hypothetical protein
MIVAYLLYSIKPRVVLLLPLYNLDSEYLLEQHPDSNTERESNIAPDFGVDVRALFQCLPCVWGSSTIRQFHDQETVAEI